MNRKLKLIFVLCLVGRLAISQTLISGKVVDKNTSEPVPFAHIFIVGTSIGSISDLYGHFSLKVPDQHLAKEFQVSCLGFEPTSFLMQNQSEPIIIRLEEDIIRLEEVVVKPKSAVNLLKDAFAKIYDNYDTTDLIHSGYYEMISKVDTTLVRKIEAMIDIYKPKLDTQKEYKRLPSDSIYISEMYAQSGKGIDYKLKAMVDWENTPYLLGNRDFVREFTYVKNSEESMLDRYNFRVENMILLQDRETYVISVTPKKGKRKTYWNGKIFLDEETLAFSKIDVTSTPKMFKKLKTGLGYKLQSKVNNVKYDSGAWKESVNYIFSDGKWHFSSVNSSKQFLISSKKRNMIKVPVTATVQYKTLNVTESKYSYDSTAYLPKRSEGYWNVEQFMESKYDSTFWNEFDAVEVMDSAK
ncbi:MAG: carboxypeptidase-like regulatory domain-containing protein [Bacteroidota bacterium]